MSHELTHTEVVLIGGGVIGCASALALAEAGAQVLVLERGAVGSEASSAAAGILGAQAEAHGPGPFHDLATLSLARYPELAARLAEAAGIDVELRRCGITEVVSDAEGVARLQAQARWQGAAGLELTSLDAGGIAALEPRLAGVSHGLHFANDGRIDPPSLVAALHAAALRAGARFRDRSGARRIRVRDGVVSGVVLEDGTELGCGSAVVTAGSWSGLIEGLPKGVREVQPARGQMIELQTSAPLLRGVVFGPRCYLVPRDDGRVLVGSTLEFVGHQRGVTTGAVRDLLDAAIALVPDLAKASFTRAWSSFRPYTSSGLPLLSATPTRGLYLATGHHRNGILLAPITAEIVRALVLGASPPIDLRPFGWGEP